MAGNMEVGDYGRKWCGGCKSRLARDSFWKNAKRADGLQTECKKCMYARNKDLNAKDPERVRQRARAWYSNNQERARAAALRHYYKDHDRSLELGRARDKSRRSTVIEKRKARAESDPAYALRARISARLRAFLAGKKAGRGYQEILGYSAEELKAHIERQFVKGMGWHNKPEWHIDHIVPLAAFEVSGPDDPALKVAWGLPNLRPCWAKENIKKQDKRIFLI